MAENLAIFESALDADDVVRIARLETGDSRFFSHRHPKIVKHRVFGAANGAPSDISALAQSF